VSRVAKGLGPKTYVSLSLDDVSSQGSQDVVGERIVGFAAGAPTWAFKSKSSKPDAADDTDGDDDDSDEEPGKERGPHATMADVKDAQATHCGGMMLTSLDEEHKWVLDIKPAHEGDAARAAKLVQWGWYIIRFRVQNMQANQTNNQPCDACRVCRCPTSFKS
jgi:hypothetical protein